MGVKGLWDVSCIMFSIVNIVSKLCATNRSFVRVANNTHSSTCPQRRASFQTPQRNEVTELELMLLFGSFTLQHGPTLRHTARTQNFEPSFFVSASSLLCRFYHLSSLMDPDDRNGREANELGPSTYIG